MLPTLRTKRFTRTLVITAFILAGTSCPGQVPICIAGPYKSSAHGNTIDGVKRPDAALSSYSVGNCAHCHEMHTSLEGTSSGTPSPFTLFAENFSGKDEKPYLASDNFCFACHDSNSSTQVVQNYDYATTFGGYDPTYDPDSLHTYSNAADILATFNWNNFSQSGSYHNLKDIQDYAATTFPDFFTAKSNPCNACHNPHLVRRNNSSPTDPDMTAISRPTDHNNLWGDNEGERLSDYITAGYSYQPPYKYNSTSTYEPAADQKPDYNTFCLDCHKNQVPATFTISYAGAPSGYLAAIDWESDIHGKGARYHTLDGVSLDDNTNDEDVGSVRDPYLSDGADNYVLACVDCHEPHATILTRLGLVPNVIPSYLLRKEINGEKVSIVTDCGFAASFAVRESSWCGTAICNKCHVITHSGNCLGCHHHGGISSAHAGHNLKAF